MTFFHLCGDTAGEGDFYVYAPSNHVYFVESDFPDELYTSTGQAAKHRLHLQATMLEE
ncbi:hypothetical protein KSC_057470 [Ktedonobacter sp. SOSP1-52]|nr:hypothetical protein KSC_057470 [Ktedonobacter sp. SOSP1-52]